MSDAATQNQQQQQLLQQLQTQLANLAAQQQQMQTADQRPAASHPTPPMPSQPIDQQQQQPHQPQQQFMYSHQHYPTYGGLTEGDGDAQQQAAAGLYPGTFPSPFHPPPHPHAQPHPQHHPSYPPPHAQAAFNAHQQQQQQQHAQAQAQQAAMWGGAPLDGGLTYGDPSSSLQLSYLQQQQHQQQHLHDQQQQLQQLQAQQQQVAQLHAQLQYPPPPPNAPLLALGLHHSPTQTSSPFAPMQDTMLTTMDAKMPQTAAALHLSTAALGVGGMQAQHALVSAIGAGAAPAPTYSYSIPVSKRTRVAGFSCHRSCTNCTVAARVGIGLSCCLFLFSTCNFFFFFPLSTAHDHVRVIVSMA